jgi:NADH dehydrogenase FAD-containing subunit
LSAARAFERQLREGRRIVVTLVSRDNHALFTPMLAEVASGEVDSAHIATPTRSFLRGVHARQREVVGIDLEQHCVELLSPAVQDQTLLPFKHLGDAQRIHDRVLDCFDWAAAESDPAQRRALLTFVVAGGGFAGSELAAALADFVRDTLRFYPRVVGESARVLLVNHGAIVVDGQLRVPGRPGLWAIGHCAAIPDSTTGGTYGPQTQNALREGPSSPTPCSRQWKAQNFTHSTTIRSSYSRHWARVTRWVKSTGGR